MTLSEIEEVIDYLNVHPTTSEILTIVHGVRTSNTKMYRKALDQQQIETDLGEAAMLMGEYPDKPTDDIRDSFKYAAELMKKMKIGEA